MEQISFFLEKFKTLGLESSLVKDLFIKTVGKILNAELSSEDIKIKDGVIYVSAHPALKSELFLKRQILLSELVKSLGPIKIRNIR